LNTRSSARNQGRRRTTKAEKRQCRKPCCNCLPHAFEGKKGEDYIFTRDNGKPVKDFAKTWRKACINAGVPGLLFHDLRRTAARNLRRAGLAETLIMKIGGWRTPSVFHRYAITNRQDMAAGMRQYEADKARREAEFGHSTGTNDDSASADATPEKIQ
jgi:integrase